MNNLEERRINIYKFVAETFGENDFDRMKALHHAFDVLKNEFKVKQNDSESDNEEFTYEDFLVSQNQAIELLDEETIFFLETLIDNLSIINIYNKEDISEYDFSGFYIKNGKIVLFA